MSKIISFSIPDYLVSEIDHYREKRGVKNKSEWFQEIVAKGLEKIKKESSIIEKTKAMYLRLVGVLRQSIKPFVFIILLSLISPIAFSDGKIDYQIGVECSGSMEPIINCHDKVYVNTVTDTNNLEIGQIYAYRGDSRFWRLPWFTRILHRLIRIDNGLCYFHGDNNGDFYDPPVECKYVEWKVSKIEKIL